MHWLKRLNDYEWNDSIDCGTYDVSEEALKAKDDNTFIMALVYDGVFDRQCLKASTVEIDIQSDGIDETFYIDFYFEQNKPRSKESFELRPI